MYLTYEQLLLVFLLGLLLGVSIRPLRSALRGMRRAHRAARRASRGSRR
jgi:hypothetical protein